MSSTSIVSEDVFWPRLDLLCLNKLCRTAVLWTCFAATLALAGAVNAQTTIEPLPSDSPVVIEGINDTVVHAIGHSVQINGTAKKGVVVLGGDVIVQGIVEDDVAAVGGSVIQLAGARITATSW